jgi:hypothetical protein
MSAPKILYILYEVYEMWEDLEFDGEKDSNSRGEGMGQWTHTFKLIMTMELTMDTLN